MTDNAPLTMTSRKTDKPKKPGKKSEGIEPRSASYRSSIALNATIQDVLNILAEATQLPAGTLMWRYLLAGMAERLRSGEPLVLKSETESFCAEIEQMIMSDSYARARQAIEARIQAIAAQSGLEFYQDSEGEIKPVT